MKQDEKGVLDKKVSDYKCHMCFEVPFSLWNS